MAVFLRSYELMESLSLQIKRSLVLCTVRGPAKIYISPAVIQVPYKAQQRNVRMFEPPPDECTASKMPLRRGHIGGVHF